MALGRHGACREVTDALKFFETSSMLVCETGLRAVCHLSRYGQDKATANSDHIALFGQLGVCLSHRRGYHEEIHEQRDDCSLWLQGGHELRLITCK